MERNNYGKTPSCAECAHCLQLGGDYEEATTHYCTLGAQPRPMCGMGEERFGEGLNIETEQPALEARIKAWHEWSKANLVAENGICDEYEKVEG